MGERSSIPARRPRFPYRFRKDDIRLLADTDAAHEDLSGPALRRILKREHEVFGKKEYARLAHISVSHLYNLRNGEPYRRLRVRVQHTQSRQIPIGERRKPDPKGKPGYLRVDTVHQGNQDGKTGLYHINAVDTVTQWQVVGCVETICERDLIPVLQAMLHQFPFRILGFHCDNGSEFINHNVAGLLEKLLVEFTKSRAYRTTDNALVEGKNGAVVRKHIGYGFIASEHAEAMQKFYTSLFNPYLNFHRPCGYAVLQTGARGRIRRVYRANDSHALRKAVVAYQVAATSQAGLDCGHAIPTGIPSQRHRSCAHHAEGQGRSSPAPSPSILIPGCVRFAQVNPVLAGEGGSDAAPFPLDPSPATPTISERTYHSADLKPHCSGSYALESLCPFRLALRWNHFELSGSFLNWKILLHYNK